MVRGTNTIISVCGISRRHRLVIVQKKAKGTQNTCSFAMKKQPLSWAVIHDDDDDGPDEGRELSQHESEQVRAPAEAACAVIQAAQDSPRTVAAVPSGKEDAAAAMAGGGLLGRLMKATSGVRKGDAACCCCWTVATRPQHSDVARICRAAQQQWCRQAKLTPLN